MSRSSRASSEMQSSRTPEKTSAEQSSTGPLTLDKSSGLLVLQADSTIRPGNWPYRKKLYHTVLYGLATFAAQLASTVMSTLYFTTLMKDDFGTVREVSLLTSSVYILGIALGPMVFAPLSEVYGRKIGVLVPFLVSGLFSFASATAYNFPSLVIYRFFCGVFAGAPIVLAGGVLADLYPEPAARGKYLAVYALFVSMGPSFGPTIALLLMHSTTATLTWRIPLYFCGLVNVALFVVAQMTLDETYVPVITLRHTKRLRILTQRWDLHCVLDLWELDFHDIVTKHLVRPFAMLVTPIVFFIVLFASYVYGVFYLIITTMPEAFTKTKGWQGTTATLPNFALFIGTASGCLANMAFAGRYQRIVAANNNQAVPEERFPIMMYGAWLMPAGIFIFSWTSSQSIHWIVPCIGIAFIGFSFILIFQGSLNYLVDTFPKYSALAIACNTFMRSIFAAGYPLFSKQLFDNLGIHWGGSVIGFIAVLMLPIPFVFYKFGKSIRSKNPYVGF